MFVLNDDQVDHVSGGHCPQPDGTWVYPMPQEFRDRNVEAWESWKMGQGGPFGYAPILEPLPVG